MKTTKAPSEQGTFAGILSLTEVGLGSVLHGLNIPFGGHVLSLNQGALLALFVRRGTGSNGAPAFISTVAALLKSLSPAGRKLTPMAAISAQGLLFNLGTLTLGRNFVGTLLGGYLLCLWGFIQPVLVYGLLFGQPLVDAIAYLGKGLGVNSSQITQTVVALIVMKWILFTGLLVWIYVGSAEKHQRWLSVLEEAGRRAQSKPRAGPQSVGPRLLRTFLNPLFLISFLMTAFFFRFAAESDRAESVWILLRPIALGLVLTFGSFFLPVEKWARRLSQNPKPGFITQLGTGLVSAIAYLKSSDRPEP